MSPFRAVALAGLFCLYGCIRDAPQTSESALEAAGCVGTTAGHGCVTLRFMANGEVRENTPRPLRGRLNWGLYRDGDVGLFGPDGHKDLYGNDQVDIDITQESAVYETTVADVAERSLQIVAFLDTNGNGEADDGDAVTFPSDAFAVPPDQHTIVTVEFDFIR